MFVYKKEKKKKTSEENEDEITENFTLHACV